MKGKIESFLVKRLLRDMQTLPFMCIIQDGGEYRVYTRGMKEIDLKELRADLFLLEERDLNGTAVHS